MNKFLKIFFLSTIAVLAFNCEDDEELPALQNIKINDFAEQNVIDDKKIINFLKYNYVEVINNPGAANDQDVVVKELLFGNTATRIFDMPNLKTIDVTANGITYKVYFLQLREGSGERPCNVDNVFMSYSGQVIQELATAGPVFDFSTNPQTFLPFFGNNAVIRGFSEILPQFKTAIISKAADGSNVYNDFGAGIMFIPSGLAYYNVKRGDNIPEYSPLMFKFKLFNLARTDQDNDGIPSYLEDIKGVDNDTADGYVYKALQVLENGVLINKYISDDDTDNDGIPDFVDVDDDNDLVSTKLETSITGNLNGPFFPFNNILDDPLTPLNETQIGIPDCSGNGINPTRKRKHLDGSCNR